MSKKEEVVEVPAHRRVQVQPMEGSRFVMKGGELVRELSDAEKLRKELDDKEHKASEPEQETEVVVEKPAHREPRRTGTTSK